AVSQGRDEQEGRRYLAAADRLLRSHANTAGPLDRVYIAVDLTAAALSRMDRAGKLPTGVPAGATDRLRAVEALQLGARARPLFPAATPATLVDAARVTITADGGCVRASPAGDGPQLVIAHSAPASVEVRAPRGKLVAFLVDPRDGVTEGHDFDTVAGKALWVHDARAEGS